MRQSTSHQAGTLEAQSPPLMMPGLKLSGWLSLPEKPGDFARLVPLGLEPFQGLDQAIALASIAFKPLAALKTWSGYSLAPSPALNQITPTWAQIGKSAVVFADPPAGSAR